jgi:prepilin-type N-terminal cleavage/methylation domain-containing protein
MTCRGTDGRAAGGFTLIELLVVMAIMATLIGIGVVGIPYMMRRGDKAAAETFLASLTGALEAYQTAEGAYPPTSLADYPGVGSLSNNENLGIESLVLCMNSARYRGSFDFAETKGCTIENFDNDQTQVQLTRFGTRDLFEAVDPWGTPYAYFEAKDYGRAEQLGRISGENEPIKATPWTSPKLKRAYRHDKFQLISAGPDKAFNTADDVTNFQRE